MAETGKMIRIKCSKCKAIIWISDHEERDFADISRIEIGEYFQHFCPVCERKTYCSKEEARQ